MRAVARLDPDPNAFAALAGLAAAAPPDEVARARRRRRSAAPAQPPALADFPGAPRRLGHPADWTDHGPPADPLPDGEPCAGYSRHRYVMPVHFAATAGGPNLLVVAANPSCPDDKGTFVRQVRDLAKAWHAASCGVVNLITRRTLSVPGLAHVAPDDLVGPRQRPTLHRALSQADVVVLAHGRPPGSTLSAAAHAHAAERDHLYARLHDLVARQGLVVVSIDGKATQPSRGAALAGRIHHWLT